MNGTWFTWGKGVNGNTPRRFVAAWRHVHDVFVAAGATNANWVWCPYVEEGRERPSLRSYYPGGEYVDWACVDGYNWGRNTANPQPWKSFSELFGRTYKSLTETIAPGKPIMIAEFASNSRGGQKARWIREMFEQLPQLPAIRALVWFDSIDRGIDWPIETSRSATKAFAAGIRSRVYAANRFATLAAGPIKPLR
jgi:beta-mannanase